MNLQARPAAQGLTGARLAREGEALVAAMQNAKASSGCVFLIVGALIKIGVWGFLIKYKYIIKAPVLCEFRVSGLGLGHRK